MQAAPHRRCAPTSPMPLCTRRAASRCSSTVPAPCPRRRVWTGTLVRAGGGEVSASCLPMRFRDATGPTRPRIPPGASIPCTEQCSVIGTPYMRAELINASDADGGVVLRHLSLPPPGCVRSGRGARVGGRGRPIHCHRPPPCARTGTRTRSASVPRKTTACSRRAASTLSSRCVASCVFVWETQLPRRW